MGGGYRDRWYGRFVRRRLPAPLRLREFALLWSTILTARFASAMVDVAVGWQVYAIHKRPFDLGLIGLAEFVPLPLLALPAGHLSDRFPRRRIAVVAGTLNAGIVALLLVVTIHGARALWPFVALAAAAGIATVIGSPALNALTPEILPVELLPGAVALRSVAGQTAVVSGPAIGGLLFAVRPELVYSVALGLLVAAVGAALSLKRRPPVSTDRPPGLGELVAGVRFVLRTRILLGAIGLDLFAVLFGGAVALLPLFARSILHTGPVGLGVLRSAPAVGALVAGVMLGTANADANCSGDLLGPGGGYKVHICITAPAPSDTLAGDVQVTARRPRRSSRRTSSADACSRSSGSSSAPRTSSAPSSREPRPRCSAPSPQSWPAGSRLSASPPRGHVCSHRSREWDGSKT